MPLSFQEKSLWLLLTSLLLVFGLYFASALPMESLYISEANVAIFILMIVLLVVIQIIGHILLALTSLKELTQGVQEDERDKLITLKASNISSYVLVVGVLLALTLCLFIPGNFVFAHVLLGFWVAAQVVEIALQLYFYRRGA